MYELSYLISGNTAENDLSKVTAAVENKIQKIGGQILNKIEPIKKNLSYPIKKQNFAYLTTIYFEVSNQNFQDFHKTLKLNSNILRHLLIEVTQSSMNDYIRRQLPEHSSRHSAPDTEFKKEKNNSTNKEKVDNDNNKKEKAIQEKQTEEIPTETEEEIKETPIKKTVAPKQEKTTDDNKEKVKIEDIDKKIDEILNKTNI